MRSMLLAVEWDTAADVCTVQTSTPGPIRKGTVALPVLTSRLTSEVLLLAPDGATATGHCALNRTGFGACTFATGTGSLAGFHADLTVTTSPNGVVNWDGTYYFGSNV